MKTATSNPSKFYLYESLQEKFNVEIDANKAELASLVTKTSKRARARAAWLISDNERLRIDAAESARWKAAYGQYCPERGWTPA